MKNISPLAVWDVKNEELIEGVFFSKPEICSRQKRKICSKYYSSIVDKKGFHTCHAGLTSYSTGSTEQLIYTGFKTAGYYDVAKTKKYNDYLPTIPVKQIIQTIHNEVEIKKSILEIKRRVTENRTNKADVGTDKELIDFSIHEVRKFNGEIKRISEELLGKDGLPGQFKSKVKSIFASSSLISVRLSTYDIEENPQLLTSQKTYLAGVFKKFQKASHCLDNYARDNNVRICNFRGASHQEIQIYPFFDFLPFVILENAIKYSPPNQDVEVFFEQITKSQLEVNVVSTGPYNTQEELGAIFDKKIRGRFASLADPTGGGYGLYFAKLVCDVHDIEISAKSSSKKNLQYNGIDYSEFKITLTIPLA